MIEYRVWYKGEWLGAGATLADDWDEAMNHVRAEFSIPMGDSSGSGFVGELMCIKTGGYYIELRLSQE